MSTIPHSFVLIQMSRAHVATACRYVSLYHSLLNGDFRILPDMAKAAEIVISSRLDPAWTPSQVEAMDNMAEALGGFFAANAKQQLMPPNPFLPFCNELMEMLQAANQALNASTPTTSSFVKVAPDSQSAQFILTASQLQVLLSSAEAFARLSLGQLEHLADIVYLDVASSSSVDTAEVIRSLMDELKGAIGYAPTACCGIRSPAVPEGGRLAWESAVRIRMALKGDTSEPLLRYTVEPLPSITVVPSNSFNSLCGNPPRSGGGWIARTAKPS